MERRTEIFLLFLAVCVGVCGLALTRILADPNNAGRTFVVPAEVKPPTPSGSAAVACPVDGSNFCQLIGFGDGGQCPQNWNSKWMNDQCRMDCPSALTVWQSLGAAAYPNSAPQLGLLRPANSSDTTEAPQEPGHNSACRLATAMLVHAETSRFDDGTGTYTKDQRQGLVNFYTSLGHCFRTTYTCQF